MKATMKKSRIWLLAILPILALLTVATVLIVTAETPTPSVDIVAQNLEFANNIYIKYAVKVTGVENPSADQFGLLYWTEPHDTYEKGTEKLSESSSVTGTVLGESCYIFTYKDLAAKQMADDIYARAYIEVDGKIYYSDVQKYSILQYAYNMLGITGEPTEKESLKTLLRDMLEYGASAQLNFHYHTDRLANADFRQITVEGGTLPDGSTKGLYIVGETVTLTAKATHAGGEAFAYWQNTAGNNVSTETTYTATVGENETYTAIYEEPLMATPDEYFTFTLQGDDTYSIKAKDINNMPNEVVIPEVYNAKAVTCIEKWAFYNCEGLTSLTIPNSITSIGYEAFSYCRSLTDISVSLSNPVYSGVGNCIIEIASKTLVSGCKGSVIPRNSSVEFIGAYAFSGCLELADIIIPENIIGIGQQAFRDCDQLKNIEIPNSVTNIGYGAFEHCSYLESITVPFVGETKDGTENTYFAYIFGASSFNDYNYRKPTTLKKVSITGGTIDSYAFYNFFYLTDIEIGKDVTSIGNYAFEDCSSLIAVHIQDLVAWCNISFGLPSNQTSNPLYYAHNLYLNGELITDLVIPDGVSSISENAFYGNTALKSVTISPGVSSIGGFAFYGCTSLTAVHITDITAWCKIAFMSDVSNPLYYAHNLYLNGSLITDLEIPNAITTIKFSSFFDCSALTTITIPNSVTNITSCAFFRCDNLANIYYIGTAEEWSAIAIGDDNDPLTSATVYFYSETEPTEMGNYWHYVEGIPTVW